jgi:hypothetical protein
LGAGEKRERRDQGGKLGTRDKEKRGKRERGTDQGDQRNQTGREEREEGAPLKLLWTSPSDAALQRRRLATRLERLGVEAPPQRLGTPCRL